MNNKIGERYRLLDELGKGAMGVVWRALDEQLGREVAVKELRMPRGLTPEKWAEASERMTREAKAAGQLTGHPHVITVLGIIEHDNRPWIIMELLPPGTLRDRLQQGPIPAPEAADIALKVLSALAAAHDTGVIHRDVKPANILIGGGRVVLTDFGIAKGPGDETLTDAHSVIGSPPYMSPQRVNGHDATPESDLWALGVTMFQMVTGGLPFTGDQMETMIAIAKNEPVSFEDTGPLRGVIEGLMQREPANRLTARQAGEMLQDLIHRDSSLQTMELPVVGQDAVEMVARPLAIVPTGFDDTEIIRHPSPPKPFLPAFVMLVAVIVGAALAGGAGHVIANMDQGKQTVVTASQPTGSVATPQHTPKVPVLSMRLPEGWATHHTQEQQAIKATLPSKGLTLQARQVSAVTPGDAVAAMPLDGLKRYRRTVTRQALATTAEGTITEFSLVLTHKGKRVKGLVWTWPAAQGYLVTAITGPVASLRQGLAEFRQMVPTLRIG